MQNGKFYRIRNFSFPEGTTLLRWFRETHASASCGDPAGLQGKDILATAQTRTGKTLAFLVPVLESLLRNGTDGVAALVLVPTRELAMQVAAQHDALCGRKLPLAGLIVGGLSEYQQLQALRRGSRVVVATPGRLEDFLDRGLIRFSNLRMLVLDEADRMLAGDSQDRCSTA